MSLCLIILDIILDEIVWLIKTRSTGGKLILSRHDLLVERLERALIKDVCIRLRLLHGIGERIFEALVCVVSESVLVSLERIRILVGR